MTRALWVVALAACSGSPPAPSPSPAPVKEAESAAPAAAGARPIRVVSVRGKAELRRAAAPAAPLQVGDQLSADDTLRTGDGSAVLDVGGLAEVQVASRTQVAVGELSARLQRVRLRDGRLSARVHGAGAVFEVEVKAAGAVARASAGEFSIQASGAHVAVAARAGEVTLAAHGKSVQIGAGQISVIDAAQPPSSPERIPPALYVKLTSSHPAAQRARDTLVQGTTAPGAVISVGHVRTVADAAGAFAAKVLLREGANDLVVESEDALGRTQKAQVPRIVVDSRQPEVESQVKW